jgi:hypothetical protein
MRATERIVLLENENATLRKNVRDVQKELAHANIRLAEVAADNRNKKEALNDVAKIFIERKRDPSWKWLRELGHKIVLAKKGKKEYTRKVKHKKGKE